MKQHYRPRAVALSLWDSGGRALVSRSQNQKRALHYPKGIGGGPDRRLPVIELEPSICSLAFPRFMFRGGSGGGDGEVACLHDENWIGNPTYIGIILLPIVVVHHTAYAVITYDNRDIIWPRVFGCTARSQ